MRLTAGSFPPFALTSDGSFAGVCLDGPTFYPATFSLPLINHRNNPARITGLRWRSLYPFWRALASLQAQQAAGERPDSQKPRQGWVRLNRVMAA